VSIHHKPKHLQRAILAEQQACDYLISQQLECVTRNFRCLYGELDLVMKQSETLIIVEVRYRKNAVYGSAQESVTYAKQQKIVAATHCFLELQPSFEGVAIRFDVVAVSGKGEIIWIKNAFGDVDF
jgi:putative endonuclease